MSFNDEDTVEDLSEYFPDEPIDATSIEEAGVEIAALTHPGLVRENNEDQFAVVRRRRSGRVMATSLPDTEGVVGEDQTAWLLAVADGLGGHTSGEVASATAIRTILKLANGLSSWIMRPSDGNLRTDMAERVELYAKAIQEAMVGQAQGDPGLAGMATTVTGAYIFASNGVIANVGDSRSYLIHKGEIQQITRDHTVAESMRDGGFSHAEIRRYSNLLTRTFSAESKSVDFDLFHLLLEPGDQVLLCSDGLTDMLSDETILNIIDGASSVKDACEQLVTAALQNGGRDNVTIVLTRV